MASQPAKAAWGVVPWGALPNRFSSFVRDLPILAAILGLFYGLLSLAHYWSGPVGTHADIQLDPSVLPKYALFSVARIAIAYCFSLALTLVYASVAAHNAKAERLLIPLLDILQSIPVLSFLPPVMLAMVALFPTRQLGIELGSILLILKGQVWNMTFSVYSSLKSIPRELLEASRIYRLSWWQRFIQLELPYSAIGLVWNSMMSVAGAWYFLTACEMFVLGKRDLRLPGLGSYLQAASDADDKRATLCGLAVMITVIVLIDQLVWRPVIAWSEKFKFEQVEGAQTPRSPILDLLRRSQVVSHVTRATWMPLREALTLHFASVQGSGSHTSPVSKLRKALALALSAVALLGILYAVVRMVVMLAALSQQEIRNILWGTGATFLRVEFTLLLAGLWTVPAGVFIGLRPRLAAFVQPVAQIAASVPAIALFPILVLVLIRAGGGLGVASILLLLLGTQWYILFNVIAGASAIPTDLKEVCDIYHLGLVERWRRLILPGIFPYLITGFVTASGGAWNASVVAEYVHSNKQILSTTGLGALISQATDSGNMRLLLGATVVMSFVVVTVNRLLWRPLYGLASTKYKLEN